MGREIAFPGSGSGPKEGSSSHLVVRAERVLSWGADAPGEGEEEERREAGGGRVESLGGE